MVLLKRIVRLTRVSALVAALAMLLLGAAHVETAGAARRTTSPSGVFAVASHASGQPTAAGRQIVDLQMFDGRLLAGYGDYAANTGPITIESFDPTTGTARDEYVQDTEAVYNFRVLGGQLHSPSIDPRVGADYAVDGTEVDPVDAVHVFDMATLDGTDRWMVGSKGYAAAAWRSTDGGATWQESLVVPARSSTDFARFYFAGVLGGKLYVQAFDANAGAQPTSMVFDGATWAPAAPVISGWFPGWRPVEFAGRLVFHGSGHGRNAPVYAFDGTSVSTLGWGYDVDIDASGRYLYLLDDAHQVRKTTDLGRWSKVGAAPANALSVAVNGRQVFVGTADSLIVKL